MVISNFNILIIFCPSPCTQLPASPVSVSRAAEVAAVDVFPWHSVFTTCETRFNDFCWWRLMKSIMKDEAVNNSTSLQRNNWSSTIQNHPMDSRVWINLSTCLWMCVWFCKLSQCTSSSQQEEKRRRADCALIYRSQMVPSQVDGVIKIKSQSNSCLQSCWGLLFGQRCEKSGLYYLHLTRTASSNKLHWFMQSHLLIYAK